jgi:hypothetical protein
VAGSCQQQKKDQLSQNSRRCVNTGVHSIFWYIGDIRL